MYELVRMSIYLLFHCFNKISTIRSTLIIKRTGGGKVQTIRLKSRVARLFNKYDIFGNCKDVGNTIYSVQYTMSDNAEIYLFIFPKKLCLEYNKFISEMGICAHAL